MLLFRSKKGVNSQSMADLFGGVFVINLDRRVDRMDEIEAELARVELPFERFPAIERKPGILGCGLSHLAVLKEARRRKLKNVLILEDDFMFLVSKEEFWRMITLFFESGEKYDVLMLSYNEQHVKGHTPALWKILEAQTASGYIVNASMYDRLIGLYEEAMPLLESTGKHWIYANDQIWKKLQPWVNWFAFRVRVGRQRPSYSDNSEAFMDHGV